MVDVTARAPVLDAARTARGTHDAATLRLLPPCAQFVLRGDTDAMRLAGAALGLDMPLPVCRAAQSGALSALWLGPDEYKLLAPAEQKSAITTRIVRALAKAPYALVAVGHRDVRLDIEGPQAARVLNAGCPLDLDLAAFPPGMCTRTVLAKAQIVLWRTGPDNFQINVWRSFTPYVWDTLIEARSRL